MDYEKETKDLDIMLALLKAVKANIVKAKKLSDKSFAYNTTTHTFKAIQKINADHNWQMMNLEKSKVDFARYFKTSILNVNTDTKKYSPSSFHTYKH